MEGTLAPGAPPERGHAGLAGCRPGKPNDGETGATGCEGREEPRTSLPHKLRLAQQTIAAVLGGGCVNSEGLPSLLGGTGREAGENASRRWLARLGCLSYKPRIGMALA